VGAGLDASSAARQRLYLHVGLPKSGTTFLQRLLADNRPALREVGYVYPFVGPEAMFHAAVELRAQHDWWGLAPAATDGSWDRLLTRVREVGATGVVSHEILAGAAGPQLLRVARDTADLDLHVVVTARDLARQVPAHWQEEVKNGVARTFAEFEARLFTAEESSGEERGFWRTQDLPAVLARWAAIVPADRVHVVVVPPAGAPPGELWRRFAAAVGVEPGAMDDAALAAAAEAGNDSLGAPQVALLREVVLALDGRIAWPAYAHVVKRWFAQRGLAVLPGRRPVTPPALHRTLVEVAATWPAEVAGQGYRVHGDLADLLPGPPPPPGTPHPDDVSPAEVSAGLPGLLAFMLEEVARLRGG
jgi:hypothetical protein